MFQRAQTNLLVERLREPRRTIQVLLGPRQCGKTTSLRQALDTVAMPYLYVTADTAVLESPEWLSARWVEARALAQEADGPVVLAIDEVQKVTGWSAWVKRYWDEDTFAGRDVRVVLTGSSPLLVQRGLSDSLAGRFEVVRYTHWLWPECREAFGWDLDTYIFYGGYPGAAPLVNDQARWRAYILDSIVETTVSRDILLMARIDKPALLRRVFNLACEYASREITYAKMVGALTDAGNTTTVAHYLELLGAAGLVSGLEKYSPDASRRRRSTPKIAIHNTALSTAITGRSFEDARVDRAAWGRMVEAAVGAHLIALTQLDATSLYYWRHRISGVDREVDYVIGGSPAIGIEVKSGTTGDNHAGLAAFEAAFGSRVRTLLVGPGGVSLDDFLSSGSLP